MATLKVPDPVPSPAEDCEQLRKAFQEWGTNKGLIRSILAHRNEAQRKLIRETYAQTYGEDILKDLDKELSNDFELLVSLLGIYRYEGDEVKMTLAKSEAKWLDKKIVVEKAYSHEDVIRIVTTGDCLLGYLLFLSSSA